MAARNVLGGELQECGTDPVTGFTRSGSCEVTPEDVRIRKVALDQNERAKAASRARNADRA